jgi:hypothetical protein
MRTDRQGRRTDGKITKQIVAFPSFAEAPKINHPYHNYTGADKSLARPTSQCILFDG